MDVKKTKTKTRRGLVAAVCMASSFSLAASRFPCREKCMVLEPSEEGW